MGYFCIFLTIVFTVYGQLIIKQQVNAVGGFPAGGPELIAFLLKFMVRPWVVSGFVAAILASVSWIAALSRFELSYAYPFMSLNFVVVVALSFWLFQEDLNSFKLIGLALICVGVLIVSRGS